MLMTKQDIAEELKHQQEILDIRRKNLKHLERQEATYGLEVPVHIISQIERLTSQIRDHIAEIDRLQTLSVEDRLPINEAEYKMVLAEVWNTPTGRPSYVGMTRLEHARLRLHITPERAKEIEAEVRDGLATETYALAYDDFMSEECQVFCRWLRGERDASWESFADSPGVKAIRRMIALDTDIALFLLYEDSSLFINPDEINVYALCYLFQMHRHRDEYPNIAHKLSQISSLSHISIPDNLFGYRARALLYSTRQRISPVNSSQ